MLALHHYAWEPLQFLIARVDLETAGFQGGNAKEWFRPFRAKRYGPTDDHPFELDLGYCCFERDRFPVREYIVAISSRFESDRF